MQASLSVTFDVSIERIRLKAGVLDLLQRCNMPAQSFFARGHINGHYYRAPLRHREGDHSKASHLLAYYANDASDSAVHFGDLVVFTKSPRTGTNYAVICRRPVVRHSASPFYVCVGVTDDLVDELVLIPVRHMVCACSEMVMAGVLPEMRMVLFHQLSGALHNFA